MTVLSQAEQRAEADARSKAGINPGDTAAALDVIDADTGADQGGRTAPRPGADAADPQRPTPPIGTKFDDRRADIVKRFRGDRAEAAQQQADEISEFTRSGMPPEFAEPNAPVIQEQAVDGAVDAAAADAAADGAPPAPAAEHAAPPTRVKVKVRGEEREMPLEEVIAKAQIALAADNYLDEARSRLDSVERLQREITNSRTTPGGVTHPTANAPGAETAGPSAEPGVDPQHPEDPIGQLLESIQFGEPAEARERLQNTLASEAAKAAQQALLHQRLRDEGARTVKVLTDFKSKHADLAADPLASSAIERRVLDLQVEDIKALGIDPATLRNGEPVSPADIADAHRFYRAEGFKVRKPDEMLEKALADFQAWKGQPQGNQPPAPAATPPSATPNQIVVERAPRPPVQQQPSRTVTSPAAPAAPASRDRSQIVQDMIGKRNAPRGKIVA